MNEIRNILMLGVAFATSSGLQFDGRKVDGLALVSSDPKVIATARKEFQMGEPTNTVTKRFSPDRFLVRPWGRRSLIVVDLASGPIGQLRRRIDVAKAMIALASAGGTLDVGKLTADQVAGLYMDGLIPSDSKAEGAVGLVTRMNFSVRRGNETKRMDSIADPDRYQNTLQELNQKPLVVRRPEGAEGKPSSGPKQPVADEADIPFLGIAAANFSEGLQETAKTVTELETELKSELEACSIELLQKKLGAGSKRLPSDEISLEQVPDGIRKNFEKTFEASWESLGFASQGDAANFLKGCDGVKVSTGIGAICCIRPRDLATGRPMSTAGFGFSTISGGYLP